MNSTKKRSASDASLGSLFDKTTESSSSPYSYGLFNLPSNCRVLKIDIDGEKNMNNVRMDDRLMVSNFIETAAEYIPDAQQLSKECGVVIKCTKEVVHDITLVEYTILLQFHIDTVVEIQNLSILQHINPLRCSGKDSIKIFCDSENNKQCVLLTVASTLNPVRLTESVLIHQHFTTTLFTTDNDDSSSKNALDEVSINRKRACKRDVRASSTENGQSITYKKGCDNK